MTPSAALYAQYGSSVVALAMLIVVLRWATTARWMFVALFLWAALTNMRVAIYSPQDYLGFAPLAVLPWYRDFILGFFARHTAAVVGLIALGQFMIAELMACDGRLRRIGYAGAITFLLAIVPLGVGSGFPATVVMAMGVWELWKQEPVQRSRMLHRSPRVTRPEDVASHRRQAA